MTARIGPKKPVRHFLAAWRKHRGLTQQQLADRLESGGGEGVGKDQVSRWERHQRDMTIAVQGALAEALNIETLDLFRDPDQPSADALLRNASPQQRLQAIALIETLLLTGTDNLRVLSQDEPPMGGAGGAAMAAGGTSKRERKIRDR